MRRCPKCGKLLHEDSFRQASKSAPFRNGGNLDEVWLKYGAYCGKCARYVRISERTSKQPKNWEPVISLEQLAKICEQRRQNQT